MPDSIHDKGYKRILSKKKHFLSLLKGFVKTPWVQNLREEDLELIDKEFIPRDFKYKEADLIYKIKINRKEVYVYFLLELQSSVDFTIPIRLLGYITDLYKRIFLDTPKEQRERKGFRLPAIIPCVLYNGLNSWTTVHSFKEYLKESNLFEDFVIDFQYILLNVNQYDKESLLKIGNLISSVFILDKKFEQTDFKKNLEQVTKLVSAFPREEQTNYWDWISDVLMKKIKNTEKGLIEETLKNLRKKGEDDNMTYALELMLDEWKEENKQEGLKEGLQEGRQKGRQEERIKIATTMLGSLDDKIITAMTGLSMDEINRLKVKRDSISITPAPNSSE
ncbi:MAG: Rpn family recombination-promoting nuclease/putative transposase [Lachnoclostridium sp.]|nr:Rpn family recombination-promoting nuclease/putative transposase [Lachnoclostridium sp.]